MSEVTSKQFIEEYAKSQEITKAEATRTIKAVFGTVTELLKNKETEKVSITMDFGSFRKSHVAARKMKSPATGKEIKVPASERVTFRPSSKLKNVINGK